MKKIFYIVALALVSSNIMAATNAACYLTLTSDKGGSDVLKIFQDPATDNTFVSGVDISKFMNSGNSNNLNIYTVQGTTNVSQAVTDDVEALPIIVQANQVATNYTMTFSNVQGTLYLFDKENNVTKKIVDGEKIDFTAAVNETIADRFVISKAASPVVIENSVLYFKGLAGKKVKVADKDGKEVIAEKQLASNNETIDLSTKDPGRYVLTLDGKDYQIDVRIPEIPEAKYQVVTKKP